MASSSTAMEASMAHSKRTDSESPAAAYVKEAQVSGIVDRQVMTEKKKTKTQFSFVIFVVWSDGITTTVWRSYERFFQFQVQLLMAFPEEAGEKGKKRIIPYLPGKKMFTRSDAKLAAQREPEINDYSQKLVKLPAKVSQSELVTTFFTAVEGDPSYAAALPSASYSKSNGEDAVHASFNKGFKPGIDDGSEEDEVEEDIPSKNKKGSMKKANSSEALLTERERSVSQVVVEIHTPFPVAAGTEEKANKGNDTNDASGSEAASEAKQEAAPQDDTPVIPDDEDNGSDKKDLSATDDGDQQNRAEGGGEDQPAEEI